MPRVTLVTMMSIHRLRARYPCKFKIKVIGTDDETFAKDMVDYIAKTVNARCPRLHGAGIVATHMPVS